MFVDELIFLSPGEITNKIIANTRKSYDMAVAIDGSGDKCESPKAVVQNQLNF